jgi:putative flippase GtrA
VPGKMVDVTAKQIASFVRFGLSGLPGFLIAIAINVWVVERFHWPKPVAYVLVMWIQMSLGWLMCRTVVFRDGQNTSALGSYFQFALSMGIIRIADWLLYTTLVELVKVPYVLAQISTSAIFLFIKFLSAKAIFRPSSSS